MIKAIIFDLGNVLVKQQSNSEFAKQTARYSEYSYRKIYELFNKKIIKEWNEFDEGKYKEKEYYKLLTKQLKLNLSFNEFKSWYSSYVNTPLSGAETLLKNLSKEYFLYSITDNNPIHFRDLKKEHNFLKKYFKKIYTSYEYKARKNKPIMFIIFLKEQKLKPNECIFIDNSIDNINTAKKLKFHTIHFNMKKSNSKILKKKIMHCIQTNKNKK